MNLYAREDDCLDKNINGYAIFCNVYCRANIGPQKVILIDSLRDGVFEYNFLIQRLKQIEHSERKIPKPDGFGIFVSILNRNNTISAWRTGVHVSQLSSRTSFFPSFWGHES